MNIKHLALCAGAIMAATPGLAREPNAPFPVPAGATLGVPTGANPPPGQYLSIRSAYSQGQVVDNNGNDIPVKPDVAAVALVYSNVPGIEIMGGTYRFTAILPIVSVFQNAFGTQTKETGIGDITIAPLNLSWMTSPGTFFSAGVALNLPTGSHTPNGLNANTGTGAFSVTLNAGVSKFSKDWTLSANAALTVNGKNRTSAYTYKSAPDLLIEASAFRNVGNGLSVGGLAYYRTQIGTDTCSGTPFPCGGSAEQLGLGIGFSKRWGPNELNVNLVAPVKTRNVRKAAQLQVNYSIPLSK